MKRTALRYADLATYLAYSDDTQAGLAKAVGSTQAHISRIARGELIPRPALAAPIARYCSIPLDSFTRAYLARQRNGAAV